MDEWMNGWMDGSTIIKWGTMLDNIYSRYNIREVAHRNKFDFELSRIILPGLIG